MMEICVRMCIDVFMVAKKKKEANEVFYSRELVSDNLCGHTMSYNTLLKRWILEES
jgi:hypothetical protein